MQAASCYGKNKWNLNEKDDFEFEINKKSITKINYNEFTNNIDLIEGLLLNKK